MQQWITELEIVMDLPMESSERDPFPKKPARVKEIEDQFYSAVRHFGETAVPQLIRTAQYSWIESLPLPFDCCSARKHKLRVAAIVALSSLGHLAKTAVPVITKVLKKDKDSYTRHFAALALGNIGSSDAVPALLEAQQDCPFVANAARQAVERIRSK